MWRRPMRNFNVSIPTKIYFGNEILNTALQQEKSIITGNIMIVTGKSAMRRLGYIDKLQQLLKNTENVNDIVIYEGISPNPKIGEINAAVRYGIKHKVNAIIGLGGGSSIDAAKAAAVGIGTGRDIEEYVFGGKIPPAETLPIIAIPTTAGTGSELSKGAIITSVEKRIKTGLRGENIYPKVSIIDPTLTYKVPDKITRETGFDVFTHATETYISKQASPFTEMLSIEAVKIVAEYLPILVNEGENKEARYKMCYASMLMGINLGNASTCLPHRLQYPVGALTDTSHGLGLASIYKAWIFFGYEFSKEKFNMIGSILSRNKCNDREAVMKSVIDFMGKIKVSIRMSDLGLRHEDLRDLSKGVTGSIENDPASVEENIIQKIYEASI
jgi:alcohol dehydrogenase